MTSRYPHRYGSQAVYAIRHESTAPHKRDALAHLTDIDPTTLEAPAVDVATVELLALLRAAVATLPDRMRVVVEARMDGATLAEVGRLVGLSTERARQIELAAVLGELRKPQHGIVRMVQVEEADEWGRVWHPWRPVAA